VSYSWTLRGQRKRVPYENPRGRRVNVLAALVPDGPTPSLTWDQAPRTLTSADLLAFLDGIPRPAGQPLVVVLDNGSSHVSKLVKAASTALWAKRIYLYYLPPYSPELNAIERVFRVIKHYDLPERTYTTLAALETAIDAAFTRYEAQLLARTAPYSGLAA
jgi:putative transposase